MNLNNQLKYKENTFLYTVSAVVFTALCTGALLAPSGYAAPATAVTGNPDVPAAGDKSGGAESSDSSTDQSSFGNYLSGRFAESRGDTQNGIPFLRESLKRNPDDKELQGSLYRMLMLSGQIEEAVPLAAKLAGTKVVEEGSEFSPEMLTAVAEAKHENYAAASKQLGAVHKAGFNTLLVPLLQAWIKLGAKDIKSPIEAKDIMPETQTILPHIYLNAAFINDIAGFSDQAQKQYEASVKDPRIEPFRAVEALVNFYDRKGLADKRKQLVTQYLAAHGDSFLADELLSEPPAHPMPLVNNATEGLAEVFYTMANIFHGVRAPADEIATLHLALYVRPDFPAAQFLLASAYELASDYPSAIDTYKAINKDSPYFIRGRIRSVYDESEMGADKNAMVSELNAIAAERPQDIDALLAKGDILRAQNHFKEAIEAYNVALTRIKTPLKHHWIIYFSRGASYESMGQWDKAEADMKKALTLSPDEPDVLNYLGYSWLTMHRNIPEAKKMIENAYDARPEDPHIIDSMGYALYMAGDYSSAQEYFEQALERTPDDPTVNDHLGDTYWQMKRKTEARYQWERALGDNPDEPTKKSLHEKLEKGLAYIHPLQTVDEKKSSEPPSDE